MSIVYCRECGHPISSQADECPACGAAQTVVFRRPVYHLVDQKPKVIAVEKHSSGWWMWILGIFAAACILLGLMLIAIAVLG